MTVDYSNDFISTSNTVLKNRLLLFNNLNFCILFKITVMKLFFKVILSDLI